jgi:hypothetical protein
VSTYWVRPAGDRFQVFVRRDCGHEWTSPSISFATRNEALAHGSLMLTYDCWSCWREAQQVSPW